MDQATLDAGADAGGMVSRVQQNARDLEAELSGWRRLSTRGSSSISTGAAAKATSNAPPDLSGSDSPYARFLRHYGFSFAERMALVLALVPHLRPQLLDVFFTRNKLFDRRFTEFGGVRRDDGDFLPTGETLAFLLAGDDLAKRFSLQALFDGEHVFARHDILRLRRRPTSRR